MKIKIPGFLILLVFFWFQPKATFAQEESDFQDSASAISFLTDHGAIQGLEFRLMAFSESNSLPILDSALQFTEAGVGVLSSKTFTQFPEVLEIQQSLLESDSLLTSIQFLVYDELSTFEGVQAYLSSLARNGDLILSENPPESAEDLIGLASKSRFNPSPISGFGFFADIKIFLITVIIGLFILIASSMILFMVIFKARKNRREKILLEYDEQIVGPLSEILFEKELEELEQMEDAELHNYFPGSQLKKPLFKKVLIDRIIALNKKMKGDFKVKLKALYKRIGLHDISIQKLESSSWDEVVTGLVQINEMDLFEALPQVKKHVDSVNFHVRSQAVATLLNLSEEVDLTFLREQTFPLSSWQQMNYLRIIKFLYSSRTLHMDSLFDSPNPSIRLFGYKLVRMVGRVELLSKLIKTSETASDEEKIEIIKTFEILGSPIENNLLTESLKSTNPILSECAAKAAGVIGDESLIDPLLDLLNKSKDFKLKMTVMSSLKELSLTEYESFVRMSKDSDIQRISLHLSDPLLQHV